jgi:hypothetical protein
LLCSGPNVTTRRRLVPESVLLPVRICLCAKGGSKSVRATVLVYAQDEITLPSDIPLIREHRALMTGAPAAKWRYKIKFCDVHTDAMPVFFAYGRWDTNRNPDDTTPYASQHSLQTFVIHRLPQVVLTHTARIEAPPLPPAVRMPGTRKNPTATVKVVYDSSKIPAAGHKGTFNKPSSRQGATGVAAILADTAEDSQDRRDEFEAPPI